MRVALTSVLVLVAACAASPHAPPPAARPAVPASAKPVDSVQMPGLRLPKTFKPTGYAATLTVDPAQDVFAGVITIAGVIDTSTPVIWLHGKDLTIQRASASGHAIAITPRGEDLLELRGDFAAGPVTLEIAYTGVVDTLNTAGVFKQKAGGAPYVFTQLEALYARRVFPCVDEPDSKVPWQLTLDVPSSVLAVSNTRVTRETRTKTGKRFEFAKTKPLPSYLVAFGVGPFETIDAGKSKSGVPIRIVTFAGRGGQAAYAAKTTARVLDLLEDYFGIPYPYEKLDILTIPIAVGFSAMENAGLVTFTEQIVLFDAKRASWKQRRDYVATTAHEIAHQWFGDYVTMAWWDDLWLNEGFASWLGRKITARFEPAWHDDLGELDLRMGALDADSLVHARKIRQPIEALDDIYNAFDGITYSKGAAVLNTFEHYVGADVFRTAVQSYLKSRAYGNAKSEDFVAAVATASGKDVAPAFATYLDQPGAPVLATRLVCDGTVALEISQQRFVPTGSPAPATQSPWIMPVCIAFENAGKRSETCTLLTKPSDTIKLDTTRCPRWVMPTANGRGYYRTSYTAVQVAQLRDEAWPFLSWTERRALFFDVVAAARSRMRGLNRQLTRLPSGTLPLPVVLSFVPKLLAGGDRFTVGDALNVLTGLHRIITDEQRPKYEAWIRQVFGPGATALGIAPREGDDLDVEQNRTEVLRAVAWVGRDPDVVKQCVELARDWREVPESIREIVLLVAADADPDLHGKLLRDIKTEGDVTRREQMFTALAGVRDPKRVEAALELLLDPAVDIRESSAMLMFVTTEPTRRVAERFVRAHYDKLVARMPKDAVTGIAGLLSTLFAGGCDAALRDEARTYSLATFAKLPGGERVIEQSFEATDQCIASRKLVEPELRAFLAGVKIAKRQ